ncbi:MAG: hypothetical protein HOP13_17780 [Alphaproteobacteria bacterium]|nr:hypothetical protein [Alphaproteobacteria bacterium]
MHSVAGRYVATALFALVLGACGATRVSVTLAPVGLVHVPASVLPADTRAPRGSDALRIDFTSSPELLSEEGYILDDARFCDAEDSNQIRNQTLAPFLGDTSIRHPFTRGKLAAERANGANASARPVYSTYVSVARPAYPAMNQMPALPAYDLAREPRPLCVSLSLRDGYELGRTTNTLTFSAEQVASALR